MDSQQLISPKKIVRLIDLLLLLPAGMAIVAMSPTWYFAGFAPLKDYHGQAERQYAASQDLVYQAERSKGTDADRKRIRSAVEAFELTLEAIDRDFEQITRYGSTGEIPDKIASVKQTWAELKSPILGHSASRPAARRGLDSELDQLPAKSSDLLAAIESLQSKRFSRVMQICGVYFLCLLLARRFAKGKIAAPIDALRHEFERVKSSADSERHHSENIVASAPPGMLILSADLDVLAANRSFLEMFNRTGSETVGKSLSDCLSISNIVKKAENTLISGEPHREEALVGTAQGDRRFRITMSPSRPAGTDSRLIVTFEDITELMSVRKYGSELEERYLEQMQRSADGIIVMDCSRTVTGLNRTAERMFGYSQAEALGKSLAFFAQRGAEAFSGAAADGGGSIEFEARRKNGATFPVEITFHNHAGGHQGMIAGAVRDLTERKRLDFLERDCLSVLEMVTKNKELDALLSQLVTMIERQHSAVRCSISLLREGRLHLAAAPRLPREFVQALDGLPMGPASCSCGTAAHSREMTIVEDITSDPLWGSYQHLGDAHDLHAAWSIPIFSGLGTVLGTFAMYSRKPGRPAEGEVYLMEMASRLSSVAIEQRQMTEKLTYQANHDTLTTLPNRALFADRLQQSITRARRNGTMVGLLFIDLDRFKRINDTLGHSYGDALLQQVSQRLRAAVRAEDTLARMGGDEFAVIIDVRERVDAAREVARKLLEALKTPFSIAGKDLFVTASVGISMYPADGQDAASLLRYSDSAMYRAKESSRNSFECFTPEMGDNMREQLDLEHDLHRALQHGELSPHYQPQFNVKGGKLAGWETLLRWNHPSLGLVLPGQFIPAAEESGLIEEIGAFVLERSCLQNKAWQRAGHQPLPVAVNMSSLQLDSKNFVGSVDRILHETKLDPKLLELEVTESVLMKHPERYGSPLKELRDLGVRIAIDDFGTGYSSLSYLQHLPFHSLKIDRSFMTMIKADGREPVLIDSIVNLTHSLGMSVTAEGVETPDQLEALSRTGCDRAQGFLLSKVLTAESAERFLMREYETRSLPTPEPQLMLT